MNGIPDEIYQLNILENIKSTENQCCLWETTFQKIVSKGNI